LAYIPGSRKKNDEEPEGDRKPDEHKASDIDLEKLHKAYADLAEAHRQVRESNIEMILNLAIAAEYKDPDTGNHILRISDYACELGRVMKLPDEEIEILRYASPMHDIGKIGIPDRILQKPGKLTPEEWEIMKTHTVIGGRMFQHSKSTLLQAVSTIAISHHERFDGTGYPYGIKGREIPIHGRIIAIADVFDAIVSKRCYKEGWSFDEGAKYIRESAGTHLDPDLVDAFMSMQKQVRYIYDSNIAIAETIKEFKDADPTLGA
jgi:putative two-component system response regulator